MVWITEENYEEQMHKEVEPYVYARMESGFFEVRFVGLSRLFLSMHNEDLLDLVHLLATGDIINHLLPVSMSGEAFNLGYLRFDTPVESEDRNPFESWFLDTCAKRGRRTITDDENRTTRVGDMVGNMVFDSSGLQHTARGDDDTGFILVIERL